MILKFIRSQLINFLKKYFKELACINWMWKWMLLMKESVLSFEEKTTQHWFTYFQIADKY